MKEYCLFGLEHLGCALAGDGDENEMFLLHDNTMFKNLTTTLTTSSAGNVHGVIVRAVRRDKNTPQRRGE